MCRVSTSALPRTFTCSRCALPFPAFDALQRHVEAMRHFRCTARFCQRNFDSRPALMAHRAVCRSPQPPPLVVGTSTDSLYPPATASVRVDIAARRQRVLEMTKRPHAYSPHNKNRFIYMDADNIIFSMLNSPHLHTLVGAPFSNALRLRFDKFTQRVCASADGGRGPHVKMLRASYLGAAQVLAQSLTRFGWSVAKRDARGESDLHAMVEQSRDAADNSANTLVLVTGDGNVNRSGASFRSVAETFLRKGWCVEIHAWAHSLHDGFLRLMEENTATCHVRLVDESDDISELVFAGNYNPAPLVPPSPHFHSQPPSPAHSMAMMSEFDFEIPYATQSPLSGSAEPLLDQLHALQQELDELKAQGPKNDPLAAVRNVLTCTDSGEPLTQPVLLSCCGHTVNADATKRNAQCPLCRTARYTTTPNRVVEELLQVLANAGGGTTP